MAKVQIKSEKLTPFGGIFSIMEQFDSILSSGLSDNSVMRGRLDAIRTLKGLVADLRLHSNFTSEVI